MYAQSKSCTIDAIIRLLVVLVVPRLVVSVILGWPINRVKPQVDRDQMVRHGKHVFLIITLISCFVTQI